MKGLSGNRKGQQLTIASLGTIALTIVLAVVILGLGGTILEKVQDTQEDASGDYGNQSFSWAGNDTATAFTASRVNTGSVVVWHNVTLMGLNINYSVNESGVAILNQTAAASAGVFDSADITADGDFYNMSFSYWIGGYARNTTEYGLSGITTFSEFVPTISIVAAAAIVIGVVLVFFGRRKEEAM